MSAALMPLGLVWARPQALAVAASVATLVVLALGRREPDEPQLVVLGRVGAVALLALSRPFLEVATMQPAIAVDLALFVGAIYLAKAIRVAGGGWRTGLGLALVCGLAAGAAWSVRAVLWPLGALLTLAAFRRGHAWPRWAPVAFLVGLGAALAAAVVVSTPTPKVTQVLAQVFLPPHRPQTAVPALSAAASLVGNDLGVLAVLLIAFGAWVLFRRPATGGALPAAVWLVAVGAAVLTGEVALARVTTIAALGAPMAAGVVALASIFGRARTAAALVIVVVAVVPAAWFGVGSALAALRP